MKRTALLSLLPALTIAGTAVAQAGPVVIAILPFEDRGSYGQDKEVFRALRLGLPATLASELSRSGKVRPADRARVSQSVQAQNLGPGARVDAGTAAKVGKEVGARYAIAGNFADFYGKFRIDARIIDTESGQILRVVSNNDPALQDRADLSRIIQSMADKILDAVKLASPGGGAVETQARTVPTEALTQYSLGLLYEGRGDKSKAGEHYQRALTTFPDYSEAREGLQRVR
ncbi:MAG TPA: CsgG/HfaB family protein [Gemmatimonadales bacterium]|nr:CsgG/HfaB family protein [Gemmatimonadales bacterium]